MSVKKILMLSAVAGIACSGAALAGGPDVQPGPMCDAVNLMQGFYAGIGGTYGFSNYDTTLSGNKTTFGGRGFGGSIFGGYDLLAMGKMYFGINGFFNFSGVDGSGSAASTRLQNDIRYSFGAAVEPGYAVASNLNVFGRVGYAGVNMKLNAGTSKTETKGSWVFGLGSEFGVTSNIGIRTSYTYYLIGDVKNVTNTTKIEPSYGEFMVGVNYHF